MACVCHIGPAKIIDGPNIFASSLLPPPLGSVKYLGNYTLETCKKPLVVSLPSRGPTEGHPSFYIKHDIKFLQLCWV